MVLCSYALHKKNKKILVLLLFAFFIVLNFYFDGRSNGLIFFFAGIIYCITTYFNKITRAKMLFALFLISIFSFSLFSVYVDNVKSGNIGGVNASTQISKTSNHYNPFELLFIGRSDFFVLFSVISDKPIFGHGSWAKDVNHKYKRLNAQYLDKNLDTFSDSDRIRNHSILLGSWSSSGLIGFLSVGYMFLRLFKSSFNIILSRRQSPLYIVILIYTFNMLWSFFFSPIGVLRTMFPFFAALIIVYKQTPNYLQNEK